MKRLSTILLLPVVACLTTTSANAGWIYLYPGFDWFGFRDRTGVLHAWQSDAARYDWRTKDYQVQIRGHWLSVGSDVYRLTHFN